MDYTSVDHEHQASLQLDDEENALYLGVPLLSKSNPPKEQPPKPPRSSSTKKCSYWATFTIATVQLLVFIAIIYKYGFASVHSNPFLGPSFDDLDEWCSKNPTKILENGEYWRIVTSMFCNAGMLDLLLSTVVIFGLGYHLEERWGSFRFLFTYIVSGVGGNLFSTMSVLNAISVGNGGCMFGLLGAMHVDIAFSIMHENPPKKEYDTNTSQEEHDKNGDIEEDVSTSSTNEEDEDEDAVEEVEDTHIIQSSCIVLGFLVGVWLTSITRIVYPNSLRMQKDWSVFYGGMMSGLVVGLVWEFFVSLRSRQNRMVVRVTYGLLFVAVPFLFECLLSIETSQSILKVM